MNAIRATWTNGQIVPTEPVDWPEGSELLVEPASAHEKLGMQEDDWDDTPEGIAKWCEAIDKIEPLEHTEAERAEMERYEKEYRRFNIEAVRKQMESENAE